MRLVLFIGALVALAILAACGDGDGDGEESQVLHMRSYDITEGDFRTFIRSEFLKSGSRQFCEGIQGLSTTEVGEAIVALGTPEPGWTPPPGGTLVVDQTPVPGERDKAARIVQEECERIAP